MGLFSKSSSTKYIQPEPFAGAAKYRGELAEAAKPGALKRLGRAGETYQGPLVAALSEYEETGLAGLKDWLGTDLPTEGVMYKSAADQIMKALSEEENVEYKQAYKTQALRELQEAKDRLASRATPGRQMFGGTRLGVEGEMEEDFLANLAVFQAEQDERRKERILRAAGQAREFAQYEEAAPVARTAAALELGKLPREIEQLQYDRDYQEWVRALGDLGIAVDVATGLATYQPRNIQEFQPAETKAWVQDVGGIAKLAATLFA